MVENSIGISISSVDVLDMLSKTTATAMATEMVALLANEYECASVKPYSKLLNWIEYKSN